MDDAPDFELLAIFDALYTERHLTRAATRIGKSQPAMSRALARLRESFGDPLFVRTARGILPTPRADVLHPEVKALVLQARALVTPKAFDAKTLERTFVIATSDLEQGLLTKLVTSTRKLAPGVNLTFRAATPDFVEQMESGRVDLLIGPPAAVPTGLMTQTLFSDTFLCAVRRDHPVVKRKLTLDLYASLAHVQIAPRGLPGGPVDDALAARGLARRVTVRTPSFLGAPQLVAGSDLILTAPARVLAPLATPFALRIFSLPFPVPGFSIVQAWHPRSHRDEAHRFFRSLLADSAKAKPA